MRLFCLAGFVLSSCWAYAACFFCPPEHWKATDPSLLSPLVKVGFCGPPSLIGFCPSINLAEEKIQGTMKDYLDAVKKIHTSNRHKTWSLLGTFKTPSGDAALTQVDLSSQSGPIRLLQLILIRDHTAYILTASCLKKDFSQFLPSFHKSFRSLQIQDDLYLAIEETEAREKAIRYYKAAEQSVRAQKAFSTKLPEWVDFQEHIVHDFPKLGPYWQALVIAEAYRKLASLEKIELPSACLIKIEALLTELENKTRPFSTRHDLQFIKIRV